MKKIQILFSVWFIACCSLCILPVTAEETGALQAVEQRVAAVNINQASAVELAEKLEGIGEARAQLIIEYREQHGPFTSVDQLLNIKGIGLAILEKNRKKIQL